MLLFSGEVSLRINLSKRVILWSRHWLCTDLLCELVQVTVPLCLPSPSTYRANNSLPHWGVEDISISACEVLRNFGDEHHRNGYKQINTLCDLPDAQNEGGTCIVHYPARSVEW